MKLENNGNVGREVLQIPDLRINTGTVHEIPSNDVQKRIVSLWEKVLKIENIGINDNFFNLGGDSLEATMLISMINKEFNVEIPLGEIFKDPTICHIEEFIKTSNKKIYTNIEPVEEKEYYPLSSAQKRIYVLSKIEEDNISYNIPKVMSIEGNLDIGKLESVFRKLIKRHETLRTSFEMQEEEPVQKIHKEVEFSVDYSELGEESIDEKIKRFIRPFNLSCAPLLRVEVVKLAEDRHFMLYDMHHIISDGVSKEIILGELFQLYAGKELQNLKVQYKDFAHWQNSLVGTDLMKRQEEYWLERFSDEIPVLNLPTDFPRPQTQSFEGDNVSFQLSSKVMENLKVIAQETGATLFMVLLAAYNLMLSRYSGQEDIIVGTPIAGRLHNDLDSVVGVFINTLAMRNQPEGEKTFRSFLEEVRDNSLKAYENQHCQFEVLIQKLNLKRDLSRNPLFNNMFNFQNMDKSVSAIAGIKFEEYTVNSKIAKFDLSLYGTETDSGIGFSFVYSTALFNRETIRKMAEHFTNLVENILNNPDAKLSEIEMLSYEEEEKIRKGTNRITGLELQEGFTSIHGQIRQIAEKMPSKTAMEYGSTSITYSSLEEKARGIAGFIKKQVKQGEIIAVFMERHPALIESILGIIKAGCVFVPIDPALPNNRVNMILGEINPKWIVTGSTWLSKLEGAAKAGDKAFNVLLVDENKEFKKDAEGLKTYILDDGVLPEETEEIYNEQCYIYFTSGSTGKPKGVLGSHRSLKHFIDWEIRQFGITSDFKISQLTTPSFDPFLRDVFTALCTGATLCIPEDRYTILDPVKMKAWLEKHEIVLTHMVPSLYRTLINEIEPEKGLESLKYILLAGEMLKGEDVRKHFNRFGTRITLINLYGPTETTLAKVFHIVTEDDINRVNVTIGTPIDGAEILILNKEMKRCLPGVVGEIYIKTPYSSYGYYKAPEQSEKVFIKTLDGNYEELIYKTGDLGRLLFNGSIECLGRADNQVKIRGMRIELGEIESVLLKYSGIKEAVVVAKEDKNGEKNLYAYITGNEEIHFKELREYLLRNLPEYMVPCYFMTLDRLPLNANGKIDKKALPEIDGKMITGTEYLAPQNFVQEKIAEVWERVLKIEKPGINDNFFSLGGHSLKATVVASRLHKELSVEVPLKEIFTRPTIKELSEYVEAAEKNLYSSIEPVEEREYYSLSSAQKRIYILNQIEEASVSYNIPKVIEVEGRFDKDRLKKAFNTLVRRHETLRTAFEIIEGEPVQRIYKEVEIEVPYYEAEGETIDEIMYRFIRPFDLSQAPLIRLEIARIGQEKHILLIDMHHIISDATSASIITMELFELYEGKQLKELRIQYKDYSCWESSLLNSENVRRQEEHWLEKFGGELPILDMPTDFPRPMIQSFEGERLRFEIGEEIANKLKDIAAETGSTLYMVLLAMYNILLSKYSGQEDIIVGSPIAGRLHNDLEGIVGMFVNTLAMRNRPKGTMTFREFLGEVRANSLEAYENQYCQFDVFVEKLDLKRDLSRNPLFDTMFVLQNAEKIGPRATGLSFNILNFNDVMSKFDLTLQAFETDGNIIFNLDYCKKLYKKETVERLVRHFQTLMEVAVENIDKPIAEIHMLTQEEKVQILEVFNNTTTEYPRQSTIHQIFEDMVVNYGDEKAVTFIDQIYTYREINEKANRLARKLREKGAGRESIIGIMLERSVEMIVGIIAILKAGGAYLPLDPDYPEERISFMLKDSGTEILLTSQALMGKVGFFKYIILNIEDEANYSDDNTNLYNLNRPKDLAYIIYTSGSTGTPKGVMVEHKSVIRLVKNTNYYSFEKGQRILQTGALVFDASTFEIWGCLLNGLELYIVDKNRIINPESLGRVIKNYNITTLWLTTPFFSQLVAEKPEIFEGIRYLLVGGDVLPIKYMNLLKKIHKNINAINFYGPTENTTFSTYHIIDKYYEGSIPIGKPISNSTAYIVDKNFNLQPIGVPGELCVSGDGLARGYINRPQLTSEKFIESPFKKGELLYCTGDIARWLPDGTIDFIGRVDNQVKIRGFRIELEEIETVLMEKNEVKEVIVMPIEDKVGQKYLCAYYVSQYPMGINEIREYLTSRLPDYMIPSYFVQLEKMPLTQNGKVNKNALPKPETIVYSGVEYEAPRDGLEKKLIHIWEQILSSKNIGINYNFFAIGGHSLKAMLLISKVYKEFGVDIPLSRVFQKPTIKEMAAFIKDTEKKAYISIESVEERDRYPLFSAQKRVFILSQIENVSTSYNIAKVMQIEGSFNRFKLERAFQDLIHRHETLRTSFTINEGEPVQIVHKEVPFIMEYTEAEESEIESIINAFIRPFDLSKAPLLRAKLVKIEDKKHILIYDIHHIIADGISIEIFNRELFDLYHGRELSKLKLQYKDFACWHNNGQGIEISRKHQEYWLEQFKGEIPVLNLPIDFPRQSVQNFEGDRIRFEISRETTEKLNRIAAETGSTLFMVLLTAYNIMLSKYTGQEDIVVGTPVAGRLYSDFEDIIGMFVNTLAIRNFPQTEKTIRQFLIEVSQNCLNAFENQYYQFEELIDMLFIKRDLSRNPLFDTMFILQNMEKTKSRVGELKLAPYKVNNKISKLDITLQALEVDGVLEFSLEYCTRLFKEETVKRMAAHFKNIVEGMVENMDLKLSEIDMLLEEKKQIIYGFNNTLVEYEKDKTIHKLFEEQVKKTPHKVAVRFEDNSITYEVLNRKANQLARSLREDGVGPECIVGIMTKRSIHMFIGILAILKAGGAYLPIDPEYPEDRVSFMLEDSGAELLLTQKGLLNKFTRKAHKVLDLEARNYEERESSNLEVTVNSKNLAYVIYTSGSTGKPKGVMIEHMPINNFITGMCDVINFKENKKILGLTTISFDIFVLETLLPLTKGMEIILAGEEQQKDMKLLSGLILKHEIDMLQMTPSRMQLLLKTCSNLNMFHNLKEIMIGGEALPKALLDEVRSLTKARIFNMYGPTETTVWSSVKELTGEEDIVLGGPIANTMLYIVDRNGKSQPIGIAGELCIAGDGLARGYLHREDLSAEKFVENPFIPGAKMYRTGDLAKWLPDGNIEFLGRIDNQVKLRGYRIELGEIENAIKKHADINDCIVMVKEVSETDKILVAYLVSKEEITPGEMRKHLGKTLPEYYIPDIYITLDKIPLTPNGKVDRMKLPEPNSSNIILGTEYKAPVTLEEKLIADIWKQLLKRELIGVNDNFFEMGGNSLLLILLHDKLNKQYNNRFTIADIFANPTIAKLVEFLEDSVKDFSRIQLVAFDLPKDYFLIEERANEKEVTFELGDMVLDKLENIALSEGMEAKDILLSLFTYLLYKVTGNGNVTVQSLIEENRAVQLSLDLDGITSVIELIRLVYSECAAASSIGTYMVNSVINHEKLKGERAILPLIASGIEININNQLLEVFDLILKINIQKGKATIGCEYNPDRLGSSKVRELLINYANLINMLI